MKRLWFSCVALAFAVSGLCAGCIMPQTTGTQGGQAQPAAGGGSRSYQQGERLTAHQAYQVLLPRIQEWQPKATIALASPKSRSDGKDDRGADGRSAAWRFTCASADEQTYALFELDTSKEAGSQVRVATSNVRRPAVTALVAPASWKIDSPRAMEIAQANGLKEWLAAHPDYRWDSATIELRASAEEGPYWLIIATERGKTIDFRISATDGKVYHARSH